MDRQTGETMARKAANQQQSHTAIFGAGIPSYFEWWIQFAEEFEYDADYNAPDGWIVNVCAMDPDNDDAEIIREVTHSKLMKAARVLAGKDSEVNSTVRKECAALVYNVDEHDIDACVADCILQQAVFGEVVYG